MMFISEDLAVTIWASTEPGLRYTCGPARIVISANNSEESEPLKSNLCAVSLVDRDGGGLAGHLKLHALAVDELDAAQAVLEHNCSGKVGEVESTKTGNNRTNQRSWCSHQ
jgi:hypothetical protein